MNLIQEEVQANWNRLVQQLVSFIFQGSFFKDWLVDKPLSF